MVNTWFTKEVLVSQHEAKKINYLKFFSFNNAIQASLWYCGGFNYDSLEKQCKDEPSVYFNTSFLTPS